MSRGMFATRTNTRVYAGRLPVDQYHVDLELNGPFYSLSPTILGAWWLTLAPGWSPYDGRHFVDYLSLVAATFFLWLLSRRYFRRSTAWLLAGAFFTQPILFGHAFINPKDTPFLAATLAGLTLGVQALPRPSPNGSEDKDRPIRWALGARWRWTLITASMLGMLLSAGLLFWSGWLPLAQKILESAYRGSGPAPINAAFRLLARNASSVSLDAYLARLATWFDIIRLGAAAAAMFSLLLAWAISIRGFAEADTSARRRLAMAVAAGIAIGLATAIRSVAPLVLLPLAVLYVLELRRRSFTTGIVLVGTTIVTAVAAWPYLWQSPIRHYLELSDDLEPFPLERRHSVQRPAARPGPATMVLYPQIDWAPDHPTGPGFCRSGAGSALAPAAFSPVPTGNRRHLCHPSAASVGQPAARYHRLQQLPPVPVHVAGSLLVSRRGAGSGTLAPAQTSPSCVGRAHSSPRYRRPDTATPL